MQIFILNTRCIQNPFNGWGGSAKDVKKYLKMSYSGHKVFILRPAYIEWDVVVYMTLKKVMHAERKKGLDDAGEVYDYLASPSGTQYSAAGFHYIVTFVGYRGYSMPLPLHSEIAREGNEALFAALELFFPGNEELVIGYHARWTDRSMRSHPTMWTVYGKEPADAGEKA